MSLLIGAVIVAVVVLLMQNTIIIDAIEAKSMNVLFFMTDLFKRPEEARDKEGKKIEGVYRINTAKGVRSDIVIFGFDEKSLAELGRFPWPRSVYARFLSNLNKDPASKPTGILIDVLFTENSDRNEDLALAGALNTHRANTVIDLLANVSNQVPYESAEIKARMKLLEPAGIPAEDDVPQVVDIVTPPIKEMIYS
jgi:CHASE2 domain-containing sensor protein